MRKALLSTAAVALILPAAAFAKTGVVFDGDQTTSKPNEKVNFTVIAAREPRDPTGDAKPFVGRKPLVTFRSVSGRVLRVRATTTDLNGIAYGSVAFPDKGPWTTELQVGDQILSPADESSAFPIGRRLGTPLSHPAARPPASPDGSPWLWILGIASLASALVLVAARRHRHWGAAS